MGNTLVGIAPSQIFPVEHYLTDHNELQFDISLGSTRFLKVARAKSQEGLIVVKVFAIHDPTLPLLPYKDRLDRIRLLLAPAVNCLPFQKIVVTEKAGLIMREFVKHSLYDRISTRPFLTRIEKLWVTFQVLYALHQCHKVGVCHGDIKLENVTVTSWNWVLLVDFASFKPTFLPEDNPADYSYFFDTSRRRACYIAPERFIKTLTAEAANTTSMFNEAPWNSGELQPAMDVFSAGCALLELWNEGHATFDLSQLLAYRAGEYYPSSQLDSLAEPRLRALLASMIERDPGQRQSAENYLAQERGQLFPEHFYSFLQSYMLMFSATPILSADEKIARLHKDVENIVDIFRGDDGLVIITSLVTSCIRGLHHCTPKLQCLDVLGELAANTSEETILDRILPFIIHMAHDVSPRVRVLAITTLTHCLGLVQQIPRSDANIFPEYILPELSPLATDPSISVRTALAQNVAILAETALRYLEQTSADHNSSTSAAVVGQISKGVPPLHQLRINYEIELQNLHEMVQQIVAALLTDPQTLVKQTVMESGITKLCVFFGKQKANDILLSHMITFLNDKEDKELRGSFFDSIVGVAAYVGCHCSPIVLPLLVQGLTDCSEFVTVKCVHAMSALAELGLLQKSAMYELVSESACYLVHPSLWVRQAVAGFISVTARTLSILDVQCKIVPMVAPYLKHKLIQMDRPELLLECLVSPIPRIVFDSVIKYSDIGLLVETLRERRRAKQEISCGRIPQYTDLPTSLKNLFRRLNSDGMTDAVEDHLLTMSSHLKKIHKYRTSADAKHNKIMDGRVEISGAKTGARSHSVSMPELVGKGDFSTAARIRKTVPTTGGDTGVNSEWAHMFGVDVARQAEGVLAGGATPVTEVSTTSSAVAIDATSHLGLLPERSYIQYRFANCQMELRSLIAKQQEQYEEVMRRQEWAERTTWQPRLPPPGWRPRGALVAHLHEHRAAITRLAALSDNSLFASASMDGFVRLWDCCKMEGKNIANRSKQSFRLASGVGLTSLTVCKDSADCLAAAAQDGSIVLLRVDPRSSKMTLMDCRRLDVEEEGCSVDIQYLDAGAQSLVVYATLYGSLVGWDPRSPVPAWRLKNDLKHGVITSFCLDAHQNWITLGTSSGNLIPWDLRFQLPITTISHPTGARVRKVLSHPIEHSWILASVQGNNEINIWNLETGFRQSVLWASSVPPLSSSMQASNHSACAMLAGCIDRAGFLVTGGSDQRLRFWDLENPSLSYLMVPAPGDHLTPASLAYESRLIDGTSVVLERQEGQHHHHHQHQQHQQQQQQQQQRAASKAGEEAPRAGPEQPPPGHRDWISEMVLCKASQCFLVTASRDGVIKLWK